MPQRLDGLDREDLSEDIHTSLGIALELEIGEDGNPRVPETIPLLPNKRHVKSRDRREFLVEDPQALIDAVRADGIDLVIGLQHDEVSFRPGPAAGWIDHRTGLRRKGRYGVEAVVQWTEVGREYIESRQGRYISPVLDVPGMFEFLYDDGPVPVVNGIVAASVVNIPALRMPSLNSRRLGERRAMTEETKKKICTALGLPLDAKEETILAAVEGRTFSSSEDVDEETITTVVTTTTRQPEPGSTVGQPATFAQKPPAAVDLERYVPREEYDAMSKRITALEATSNAAKVDEAIRKNRKKIATPAYEKELRDQLSAGTLTFAAFDRLMLATPESRLQAEDEEAEKKTDASVAELSQGELDFCKAHGKDPAAFAAIKARRMARRNLRVI